MPKVLHWHGLPALLLLKMALGNNIGSACDGTMYRNTEKTHKKRYILRIGRCNIEYFCFPIWNFVYFVLFLWYAYKYISYLHCGSEYLSDRISDCMRDYGFISDSAVCSGPGTPDDKINQCFGNWIDGIKCECNTYLSYDYNHHDSHYDCKHVCIKAVFGFRISSDDFQHYCQYLCGILFWGLWCQYGIADGDLFKKSFAEWKIFVRHCESKSVCHTGFVLCCAAFTYGDCIFLCEHQCEPCCAQIDGKCLENETRQALWRGYRIYSAVYLP